MKPANRCCRRKNTPIVNRSALTEQIMGRGSDAKRVKAWNLYYYSSNGDVPGYTRCDGKKIMPPEFALRSADRRQSDNIIVVMLQRARDPKLKMSTLFLRPKWKLPVAGP